MTYQYLSLVTGQGVGRKLAQTLICFTKYSVLTTAGILTESAADNTINSGNTIDTIMRTHL